MTYAGSSTTPLTSLNAIKLSAREVAGTFVAPPAFDTLLRADNAVLTGPRGSGKTTLLKMMQSEALEHWTAPEAESARESVRSVGVFIGSDRTWNEQLAMPGTGIDPVARRALTGAAFTSHVLRALVEAMDYRLRGPSPPEGAAHKRVDPVGVDEPALAARLSRVMKLAVDATSIPTLRDLLADRLLEIGSLRTKLRRQSVADIPDWADLDCLVVADAAVDAFNQAVDEDAQKWALLFDELELAPEEVVEELLGALRGAQPRLLFKLSLAPAHARFDVMEFDNAPVPGQDYEHVPLTYARKLPALRFAKALVRSTFERTGPGPAPSPERLLGAGVLDSRDDYEDADVVISEARGGPYAVGSPLWRTLKALEAKDSSFREYLEKNAMDLDRLDELPPELRASRLRKIRNIVVVREFFRTDQAKRRSRKTLHLYTGADSILSLPDGNPRMIIALVRQLFPLVDDVGSAARVPRAAQSAAIEATLQRFLALLEAQQSERVDGKPVGLMMLLDHIGDSLGARLVERPFNDNVALSLRVPQRLRLEILALFIRGINAGALVHVPPRQSDGRLPANLSGHQFRLSHLLACKYGLPIHLTPAVSLDEHLPPEWRLDRTGRRTGRSAPAVVTRSTNQDSLFSTDEATATPSQDDRV
jgi:energy-coupling factor transporter ATP-binding protein EcfA2